MSASATDGPAGAFEILPFAPAARCTGKRPLRSLRAVPALAIAVPVALLVAGTLLLTATNADRALSHVFYDPYADCWPMCDAQPWHWLYEFGCMPGLLLGITGLAVALVGRIRKWDTRRWRPGLFLALALLIGPGLLVNLCMKDYWGRPRPRQTADFGGAHEYHPAWCPAFPCLGRSFPSGHASMGFYLMSPGFLFWRRSRRAAILFVLLGLVAGAGMGLGRIIQGSHYATDVLWSAGCVYFVCLALTPLLQTRPKHGGPGERDGSDPAEPIASPGNSQSQPEQLERAA